jgi:hypothetical protein
MDIPFMLVFKRIDDFSQVATHWTDAQEPYINGTDNPPITSE